MGQLKISEMRQRAETELKEKFDIKDFHEVTLWFSFSGSSAKPQEKKPESTSPNISCHYLAVASCLNVACQVILESAGPLSLVEKRVEQWMERSMAQKL